MQHVTKLMAIATWESSVEPLNLAVKVSTAQSGSKLHSFANSEEVMMLKQYFLRIDWERC